MWQWTVDVKPDIMKKFRPCYSCNDQYFYLFINSIASVTVPILLLHAEDDFTVPHELGELVSTRAFQILQIIYLMRVPVLGSMIQPCIKSRANKIANLRDFKICEMYFAILRKHKLHAHINYESIQFQRTNSTV